MKAPLKELSILKLIIFQLIFLLFCNCKDKNIKDLQKEILISYKNDTLKKESILFTLQRIQYGSHYHGESYSRYLKIINENYSTPKTLKEKLIKFEDEIHDFPLQQDINHFNKEKVITSIDKSFTYLERVPWKSTILNSEYLLNNIIDYKINNSEIEQWKDSVYKDYGDSVYSYNNISDAAEYLIKKTTKKLNEFKIDPESTFKDLPYSSLKKLQYGSCKELSDYISYVLKTYGIPCFQDFTPNYTNLYAGHFWNVIINEKGKIIPFVIPLEVDTLGRFKSESYNLGKVYRKLSNRNVNSHSSLFGYKKNLPSFLNDEFIEDVTDQYLKTYNITLPLPKKYIDNQKVAYLSVFNNNSWTPIAWASINKKRQNVTFNKLGGNGVYLLQFLNDGYTTNLDSPFILNNNGDIKNNLPNFENLITLKITRKFPLTERVKNNLNRVNGGYFEAADNPEFKNSKILYKVSGIVDEYFKEVDIKINNKAKYVRYYSPPGSFCNIAEIEFYNSNKKLNGKVIGHSLKKHPLFPDRTMDKSFDGDKLTFYHSPTPDNSWIGIEFNSPKIIKKIKFLPRVAYNIIVPEDTYEVFYWNNRWISLGSKVAKSSILTYKNVPSNALYYIKNHSHGKDERIFTYINDEQIWW